MTSTSYYHESPSTFTSPAPASRPTPFVKLHVGFIDAPLSDRAHRLFPLLKLNAWKTGYADLTQEELAKKLRCSVHSIHRALKELEGAGLVQIQQRGLGRSNRIIVHESLEEIRKREGTRSSPSPARPPVPQPVAYPMPSVARVPSVPSPAIVARPVACLPPAPAPAAAPGADVPHARPAISDTPDLPPVAGLTIHEDAVDATTPSVSALDRASSSPDPVVVALARAGMDSHLARQCFKLYGPDRCQMALGLLEREQHVRQPGRWLFAAITRGFQAQEPSAVSKAVRKVSTAPRQTAEEIAEQERRTQEERQRAEEKLPAHLRERLQRRHRLP